MAKDTLWALASIFETNLKAKNCSKTCFSVAIANEELGSRVWICSKECGYVKQECGYVKQECGYVKKSVDMLAF